MYVSRYVRIYILISANHNIAKKKVKVMCYRQVRVRALLSTHTYVHMYYVRMYYVHKHFYLQALAN